MAIKLRTSIQYGLLTASILTALSGCGNSDNQNARSGPPPAKVKIAQPLSQEVTEWDEYTGRIDAVNSVDVRARVDGYLERVFFKAGDTVHKGDLLFQIDQRPFIAQLDHAKAELKRAKTRHELARNDFLRAEHLLRAKAVSVEEHDARSKGLREANATVQSAQANVDEAELNLNYTKVRAPIDGRIGRETVTPGNAIKSGVEATTLTFIVSTDPVYVYADIDERSALKYLRRTGQDKALGKRTPVELALADENDFKHSGYLDYISPREDTATGTLTLRGVFANPDGLLTPGFFARMRIKQGEPYRALLLPDRAIGTDQAKRFVWVVKQDNQVEYRPVTLGTDIGDSHVIKDGLQAEEWVVVEGVQKLRAGAKVNPERLPMNKTENGKHE